MVVTSRMVCFEILFAYPLHFREKVNTVHQEAMYHMIKYHNGDFLESHLVNDEIQVKVVICNEDAIGLLRDIPPTTYVLQIKDKYQGSFLYSFWKATGKAVRPPRYNVLLKKVYWSASQLERRRIS
jgi:hypothetical protein